MNSLLLILLMAALIYLCRLSGFVLTRANSPLWNQGLRFVPLSVFTALVISALYKNSYALDVKLIALFIAGLVMLRTRRFSLSVGVGLCALWILLRIYG
jgi:branched-subunit amino acid transport protein